MDSSVSGKDEIWFLRVCHHVPHELYVIVTLEKQVSVGPSSDAAVAFGWFPHIHTLLGPTWIG